MKKSLFFAFSFIGTIGISTAMPAVVLGLTGRYLDRYFNTGSKIFIVFMLLALVMSILILRKISLDAAKKLNELNKE